MENQQSTVNPNQAGRNNFKGLIVAMAGVIFFLVAFFHTWSQAVMRNPLIVSAKPINIVELVISLVLLILGTLIIKNQLSSSGQIKWSFNFRTVLSVIIFLIIIYILVTGIQNEPKTVQIIGLLIVSVLSIWFSGYVNYSRLLWFMWFLYGITFPIFIYGFTWTTFDELTLYLPVMLGVVGIVFTIIKLIEMFSRPPEEKSSHKKLLTYGCIFSIVFVIITIVLFAFLLANVH